MKVTQVDRHYPQDSFINAEPTQKQQREDFEISSI